MNIVKATASEPEMIDLLRDLDLVDFRSTYTSLATRLARLRHSTRGPFKTTNVQ